MYITVCVQTTCAKGLPFFTYMNSSFVQKRLSFLHFRLPALINNNNSKFVARSIEKAKTNFRGLVIYLLRSR